MNDVITMHNRSNFMNEYWWHKSKKINTTPISLSYNFNNDCDILL